MNGGMSSLRLDQRLELAEDLALAHLDGADLGDRGAAGGRPAGRLEVDDDERDVAQRRAELVERLLDRIDDHSDRREWSARNPWQHAHSPNARRLRRHNRRAAPGQRAGWSFRVRPGAGLLIASCPVTWFCQEPLTDHLRFNGFRTHIPTHSVRQAERLNGQRTDWAGRYAR